MKSGKKTVSKLFSMLLAAALFITMMPLGAAAAFADDGTATPVLTVTGDDLVNVLSYSDMKTLKNDQAIKAATLNDVVFHTTNKEGTQEDFKVSGVTIESLINLAGIKEGKELESVTAAAADGYSKTYTAEQILGTDLQGNKAMFIWTENGEKVQKTAIGQFEEGENNRSKWINDCITLTVTAKDAGSEPTPAPTPVPDPAVEVLSVTGDCLAQPLSYASIKVIKNDEAIKPLIREDVKFKTKNAAGTEGESTVTGVRIEDLIGLAGIKDGYVIDSVTATSNDGYSIEYSKAEVFKDDLQGNKAMFVWAYDGKKVQMTVVGQYAADEANKARWYEADAFNLTVNAKKVTKPGKPSVTVTAGKKSATVKWKKVSGAEGYVIYRSTKKSSGFKKIKTITSGKTLKFVNKKIKGGKVYYYKVKAYKKDANGNSVLGAFSAVKKVKTKK